MSKNILVIMTLALSLSGCLNVNLKSVLPNQVYYSLDSVIVDKPCKNIESTFNANINVLSPYDGKDILIYAKDSQIKILDTYKWIDLPKNMIRNAFIKTGTNHCINIESSGAVGQKIGNIRIHINDLYIRQGEGLYTAYIYANYEVLNYDLSRAKSESIITTTQDSNPIKALQDATNKTLESIILNLKLKKN